MNYEEGVKRIKYALAQLGYNVLGYEYSDEQLEKIHPWFYPRDKKKELPPEVDEFLGEIQSKYVFAAKRRKIKKVLGNQLYDITCGIRGDGLSFEDIQLQYKELRDTFKNIHRRKDGPFPKKSVKVYKDELLYKVFFSISLGVIFEKGINEDFLQTLLGEWKKDVKIHIAFYYDLASEHVAGGFPLEDFADRTVPKKKELQELIFRN